MNVFRSRKKSISEADLPRPSLENAPPLPKQNRNIFSRKKISQPEAKKEELDLSMALPSTDDFRTSLLMPNLAQRFSMLREQDDPATKIGKASDDSVLFPKRASRLDLFGLGNLDDIAEVSSIAGSFRPPFAQDGRVNSYASDGFDGYASDTGSANGSVMTRSRPGQGNKLFGGRQKVYKISANGPASKSNSRPGSSGGIPSGGGGGRTMGRVVYDDDVSSSHWQRLRAEEKSKQSFDYDGLDNTQEGRCSPSFGAYNRNRETSSSLNSNERTSTAATSMTSMNDSSVTSLPAMMAKEHARDRPLNKRMYGQGIDQQVHDQQNSAMQRLNSVRGGRGFGGIVGSKGSQRGGAVSAASSVRSGSPSPALNPSNGFDFGLEKPSQLNTRDTDSGYHGPSTVPSPISPQPADPTLAAHMDPNDLGKATASGAFNKPRARYDDQQFAQRQLQLRDGRDGSQAPSSRSETPNEAGNSRLRKNSDTSAGRHTPAQNFSRMHSDRSLSRGSDVRHVSGQSRNETYSTGESDSEGSARPQSSRNRVSNVSSRHDSNTSQDQGRSTSSHIYPFEEQHPALRVPITEEEEEPSYSVFKTGDENPRSTAAMATNTAGGGLSEMVRGHLRQQSDASSVYSDTVGFPSAQHSYHNSTTEVIYERPNTSQTARTESSDSFYDAKQERGNAARGMIPGLQPHREESATHTRSPSNDTLLERDAFADELADRRRQVEEKLRNIAESRANIDSQGGGENASKGFGLLKKSSSRAELANEGSSGRGLKKFMPGSGTATPTGEHDQDVSPRRPQPGRSASDMSQHDESMVGGKSNPRSPMRDRDFGAERRARHAAAMTSPRGSGPAAPRGQVEARKQQFAGGAGGFPRDFTERVIANPDQGKPHFHPAGRSRHYSPPRNNSTPDPKPQLQNSGGSGGSRSRSRSRAGRQPGSDRTNVMSPPAAQSRSHGKENSTDEAFPKLVSSPDVDSPQMVTPGTYPPPMVQYQQARKRSVSKAEISSPVNLVSSTYALSTVNLSPGVSLENGMDEVRAADAANSPPPVPPINPRRRAMGGFKKSSRANTGNFDSDDDRSQSPRPGLKKQMSEGANLRGRIRDRIAMPSSPPKAG